MSGRSGWRRRSALALAVILWGGTATADGPALDRIHALYAAGDLDAAAEALRAFETTLDPAAPDYPAVAARVAWQDAQIRVAEADCSAALDRADASVDHARAAAEAAEVLAAIYRGERGKLLMKMGHIEQALEDLASAGSTLRAVPGVAHLALDMQRFEAMGLSETGDIAAAERTFAELVDGWRRHNRPEALATALMDLAGSKLLDGTAGLEAARAAEDLAAQAEALLRPDDGALRADLLLLQGRIALQRSELDRAEALLSAAREGSGDEVRRAHARLLQAQVHLLRGDAGRSERLLRAALDDFEAGLCGRNPVLARTLLSLGLVTADLGRPSDAIGYLSRAVRLFEDSAGIGSFPAAEARVELAMIFNQVGEYDSATSVAADALETLSEGPSELRRAYANSALGFALAGGGDARAATRHLEAAIAEIERLRGPASSDLAPGLIRLAALGAETPGEDLARAEAYLDRAWRILRKDTASGPRLVAAAREVELKLLLRSGRQTHAATQARAALDWLRESLDAAVTGCDPRPTEITARHRLLTTAMDVLAQVEAGAPTLFGELFDAAQLAHAGSAATAIATRARIEASDPADRPVLVAREAKARERCALDRMRVIDQSGVARGFEVNRARLEARIATLSEEIARLDAQLGGVRAPRGPLAPDVEDVVGALRPGEGLLLQVTGETGSHLFWLDRDGQVYARTGLGTPALSDHVARLRASIEVANVGADEPLPAVPLDAAHALFAGLFGPFEDRMRAVERVVFVADGAARSLPMSMLVTRDHGAVSVSEPEALGRVEWLGAQKAISVMPSPRAFVALRDQPERPPAALDFVGIGNPAFARESYALPETETELVHLAGILSGAGRHAIATGPEASEAWVRSAAAVREARVLAFATHGLVNRELGVQEPALMLATPEGETHEDDGFLTASEIAMLDLRADWVILSACNTAAGRDDRAEGLSGLASSFFAAGARSLLVSHWYVPSSAAAALTVFTADAMATTGASRDEALRQAMARVRAGAGLGDAPNPRFAHPAYWAPFVIVGAPE